LTIARQNLSWGYTRLRGAMENLGLGLGRSTIQRILSEHGIEPAPLWGQTMRQRRRPLSMHCAFFSASLSGYALKNES
jgi:hypothetical protein